MSNPIVSACAVVSVRAAARAAVRVWRSRLYQGAERRLLRRACVARLVDTVKWRNCETVMFDVCFRLGLTKVARSPRDFSTGTMMTVVHRCVAACMVASSSYHFNEHAQASNRAPNLPRMCADDWREAAADDLAATKPILKFVCVKGVVFFTFVQQIAIGMYNYWASAPFSTNAMNSSVMCVEMLIFAVSHAFAFPASQYPRITRETMISDAQIFLVEWGCYYDEERVRGAGWRAMLGVSDVHEDTSEFWKLLRDGISATPQRLVDSAASAVTARRQSTSATHSTGEGGRAHAGMKGMKDGKEGNGLGSGNTQSLASHLSSSDFSEDFKTSDLIFAGADRLSAHALDRRAVLRAGGGSTLQGDEEEGEGAYHGYNGYNGNGYNGHPNGRGDMAGRDARDAAGRDGKYHHHHHHRSGPSSATGSISGRIRPDQRRKQGTKQAGKQGSRQAGKQGARGRGGGSRSRSPPVGASATDYTGVFDADVSMDSDIESHEDWPALS